VNGRGPEPDRGSLHRRLAVLIAVVAVVATGCGSDPADGELEPVTFMAGFSPQANLPFVGVYVAAANGYFTDEGLDVTIEHSAGSGEHLQLLASGEVDVTTQDAAVVLQRRADPGIPLVAVALLGQRGQQAFVAMADAGMASPADWVGHRVGFKGTPPPDLFALLDANGVEPDEVELVNVGFDVRVFTEGQVDVYPVFKSNEPDTISRLGFDIVTWDAFDYGVPTLGLTYVATEQSVEERPEMLRAFLAAALHGIAWAEENPEEAVEIVLTHTGDEADPEHQRFMLDTELAAYRSEVTDANGDAWQTAEQWQALHDLLVEHDAIAGPVDVSAAFTTDLLPGR
jgi:ABC-type nitrate/sulfonate/bicarbonate transport system substrate-binding protein